MNDPGLLVVLNRLTDELRELRSKVGALDVAEHSTTGSGAGFSDGEGDPANVAGAAADGTSTYAARRDHAHTIGAGVVSSSMLTDGAALAEILDDDGTGSGLDADLLDGSHASAFALAAAGVTNGDSHNHAGGDGAQIDHTGLSNIGTNSHATIDTHLAADPFGDHATGPRVRAYHDANQSINNATQTVLLLNSDDLDTDNMHYTSSANLTGTVAKTNGSATLTGTGTAFTSELSVGQLINVPGVAAEVRVVTAIASDTSLTVDAAFANSASGQTANRYNSGIVVRTAGLYAVGAGVRYAADADGYRMQFIRHRRGATSTFYTTNRAMAAPATSQTDTITVTIVQCQQWDWFEINVEHTAGAALNVETSSRQSPVLWASRIGD